MQITEMQIKQYAKQNKNNVMYTYMHSIHMMLTEHY